MENLPGGIQMEVPDGCFPLTTDSMVLAYFASAAGRRQILDLGSGCAALGLLLLSRNPQCHVTGVEMDSIAHEAAVQNISRNNLSSSLESVCADLRRVPELFSPGQFDCCISNPPYFSGGPAAGLTAARREDCCTLHDLMRCAAWAVKFGGDFYLVHRPERLGEIISQGAAFHMEAKRLCLLRHTQGGAVSLVLLQLRKGAKPGLKIEELALHHGDGTVTDDFRRIYHITEDT